MTKRNFYDNPFAKNLAARNDKWDGASTFMSNHTAEDFELFKKHTENKISICPMCSNKQWILQGIYYLPMLQTNPNGNISGIPSKAMPIAVAMCASCFYIIQYSWLMIQGGQNVNK